MDREQAWQTVQEFVETPGLQRHMLAVEAAMRWYADHLGEDPEIWGLAGLLHDFDWEIHPALDRHPAEGAPILRQRGCPEEVVQAILSHNTEGTGVERQHSLDFALLACDEITGLLSAAALIRPDKDVREVKLKSVKKRWKSRAFAAGVDREHVAAATEDFSRECFDSELELWEHTQNVLTAMQGIASELGLDGQLAQT
jgi:putative nucleotidyltransferase with HDIG domain